MLRKEGIRPPRHLLWMFQSITSVLVAALDWLGWQMLQQERALAMQGILEEVEAAADLVTAALQKDLSELEQNLADLANISRDDLAGEAAGFARSLPDDSVVLLFGANGMAVFPFSGWNQLFFGDLHDQGTVGIQFCTRAKVVLTRRHSEGKPGTWS